MKKTLLIMLAVLLLFSFVSCKDGSEEIIAVYEEYKTTDKIITDIYRLIYYSAESDGTVNYSVNSVGKSDLASLFNDLGIDQTPDEIKSASGTVKGKKGSGAAEVEYKDIVITYTVDGIEGDQTFKLSGTSVDKPETSDGEVWNHDYSFKLNDKEYSLSYSMNGARKYTRAIVNGKNVELRLLNSQIGYWA